eukprot:COSAG01_NODE_4330_length_5126_cov_21.673494_6_plen_112_part_00
MSPAFMYAARIAGLALRRTSLLELDPAASSLALHGSLAERSKAPGLGPGPRGRGFESHSYHFLFLCKNNCFCTNRSYYEPFHTNRFCTNRLCTNRLCTNRLCTNRFCACVG